MSVLVNGSPTKKFEVGKGLRQGDPLSPFLYVLVAEGLTGLVRKSIEIGEFESFSIHRSCNIDILQFADDTLLVGKGTWKQVWAIKVVLKAFELASGLGINYHKSKLIDINVNNAFLEAVSNVLSCKVEESNFYFLGIPVGFNPRKVETWRPIISKMRKRLSGWKNRFLNLGGRITLLKSILSSLTVFTMSFYKVPKKVEKELTSIQSSFLWGGMDEKRFLTHNGFNTPFWEANWLEGMVLKDEFPDLFEVSRLKGVSVAAMGGWVDSEWRWGDLGIPEDWLDNSLRLADWEKVRTILEAFGNLGEEKDGVEWMPNSSDGFSVASCYEVYASKRILYGPNCRFYEAKGLVWKSEVPFKIKAFGWRLLANRLPTKDLLVLRGVSIPFDNLKCSFCRFHLENRDHSFFACSYVKNIWKEIALWIGKGGIEKEESLSSFMDWHSFCKSKKIDVKKLDMVWLATAWSIWLGRNGVCFREEDWNFDDLVWNIKILGVCLPYCKQVGELLVLRFI
ncbi:uncharacterized protein LOC131605347 [Vicia villosa]|uniref:uncharacterized protein LOC131605347 n=1 Tax=Vicia villosa TaxID=3911 RepID=UPI00273C4E82|nr:uncharacterized protein LOC131605347 [Vicia villosa]